MTDRERLRWGKRLAICSSLASWDVDPTKSQNLSEYDYRTKYDKELAEM